MLPRTTLLFSCSIVLIQVILQMPMPVVNVIGCSGVESVISESVVLGLNIKGQFQHFMTCCWNLLVIYICTYIKEANILDGDTIACCLLLVVFILFWLA